MIFFKHSLHFRFGGFLKKLTAFGLALSLIGTGTPLAGYSETKSPPPIENLFQIPSELGTVQSSFTGHSGKALLFIQDAHDSLEAQENIAKIIHRFVEEKGVQTVFEEGTEGPVPTDLFFGEIKDPQVKEKTAYFFMDKLRLSGAEYAHVTRRKNFDLIGIDSEALHHQNLEAYKTNALVQGEILRDLQTIETGFRAFGETVFPKAFKEWLKIKEKIFTSEASLDYLKRAQNLLQNEGVLKLPPIFEMIKPENLSAAKWNPQTFSLEMEVLHPFMEEKLLQASPEARQVNEALKAISLFKALAHLEMSVEDYERAQKFLQEFNTEKLVRIAAKLSRKPEILPRGWENLLSSAFQFYEIARARDQVIATRLLEFKNRPANETAILVFGGFHAKAITEMLRSNQISYSVIIPKITHASPRHQQDYKQLMSKGYYSFEIPGEIQPVHSPETEPVLGKKQVPVSLQTASSERLFTEPRTFGMEWILNRIHVVTQTIEKNPKLEYPLLVREILKRLEAQREPETVSSSEGRENAGALAARTEMRYASFETDPEEAERLFLALSPEKRAQLTLLKKLVEQVENGNQKPDVTTLAKASKGSFSPETIFEFDSRLLNDIGVALPVDEHKKPLFEKEPFPDVLRKAQTALQTLLAQDPKREIVEGTLATKMNRREGKRVYGGQKLADLFNAHSDDPGVQELRRQMQKTNKLTRIRAIAASVPDGEPITDQMLIKELGITESAFNHWKDKHGFNSGEYFQRHPITAEERARATGKKEKQILSPFAIGKEIDLQNRRAAALQAIQRIPFTPLQQRLLNGMWEEKIPAELIQKFETAFRAANSPQKETFLLAQKLSGDLAAQESLFEGEQKSIFREAMKQLPKSKPAETPLRPHRSEIHKVEAPPLQDKELSQLLASLSPAKQAQYGVLKEGVARLVNEGKSPTVKALAEEGVLTANQIHNFDNRLLLAAGVDLRDPMDVMREKNEERHKEKFEKIAEGVRRALAILLERQPMAEIQKGDLARVMNEQGDELVTSRQLTDWFNYYHERPTHPYSPQVRELDLALEKTERLNRIREIVARIPEGMEVRESFVVAKLGVNEKAYNAWKKRRNFDFETYFAGNPITPEERAAYIPFTGEEIKQISKIESLNNAKVQKKPKKTAETAETAEGEPLQEKEDKNAATPSGETAIPVARTEEKSASAPSTPQAPNVYAERRAAHRSPYEQRMQAIKETLLLPQQETLLREMRGAEIPQKVIDRFELAFRAANSQRKDLFPMAQQLSGEMRLKQKFFQGPHQRLFDEASKYLLPQNFNRSHRSENRGEEGDARDLLYDYLSFLEEELGSSAGRADISALCQGDIPRVFFENSDLPAYELEMALESLSEAYEYVLAVNDPVYYKNTAYMIADIRSAVMARLEDPGLERKQQARKKFSFSSELFEFQRWLNAEKKRQNKRIHEFSPEVQRVFKQQGNGFLLATMPTPSEVKRDFPNEKFYNFYRPAEPHGSYAELWVVYGGPDKQPIAYGYNEVLEGEMTARRTIISSLLYNSFDHWNRQVLMQEIREGKHVHVALEAPRGEKILKFFLKGPSPNSGIFAHFRDGQKMAIFLRMVTVSLPVFKIEGEITTKQNGSELLIRVSKDGEELFEGAFNEEELLNEDRQDLRDDLARALGQIIVLRSERRSFEPEISLATPQTAGAQDWLAMLRSLSVPAGTLVEMSELEKFLSDEGKFEELCLLLKTHPEFDVYLYSANASRKPGSLVAKFLEMKRVHEIPSGDFLKNAELKQKKILVHLSTGETPSELIKKNQGIFFLDYEQAGALTWFLYWLQSYEPGQALPGASPDPDGRWKVAGEFLNSFLQVIRREFAFAQSA